MDIGLEVVRHIYERMKVDAEWSLWGGRGFVWWGAELAQQIWADAPFDSDGDPVCRIHVQTDFLHGFVESDAQFNRLAQIAPFASLSGFVRDQEHPQNLRLAASVYVYEDIRSWLQDLLSWVAPMQAVEAEFFHYTLVKLGETEAHLDVSDHPSSGHRQHRDDMLTLTDLVVRPTGEEPSRYTNSFMTALRDHLDRPPCLLVTGDEGGVTAEFPFPNRSSILRVFANQRHPILGNGCLMELTLPVPMSTENPMLTALVLNETETYDPPSAAYFLGSWFPSEHGLSFVTFLPNALYAPGLVVNVGMSMMERARGVTEGVIGYGWRENFEKDFQARMEALNQFMSALSTGHAVKSDE